MITKEKALENVKNYIKKRNRNYVEIENEIFYEEKMNIPYGKYENEERSIYTVTCNLEGYLDSIHHFISVDAETGEVLFTATPYGYAEDWED